MKDADYPDNMIEDYELLLTFFPDVYPLRETLAETIKNYVSHSPVILEIGCGTGESTGLILRNLSNVKLTAVDKSEVMIRNLKRKLGEQIKSETLRPGCADIFDLILTLDDDSFDVVTSSWTIHNFTRSSRKDLFKEIRRILKPNGMLINMDKYVPDSPIEEQRLFDERVESIKGLIEIGREDLYIESVEHEQADRAPEYIMKVNESLEQMSSLGFTDVVIIKRIGREAVLSCINS